MTVGLSLLGSPRCRFGWRSQAQGSSAKCTHARRAWPARELAGVAASSPESARAAAEAIGAARAYDSADELVRDPDVDVVHVCTPNHLHLPLAEAALAAGKHVICEKPLALDAAGAQRLVDAATASGLAGGACRSSTGTTPRCARRESASATGETGPLRLLHGTYLQDWLLRPGDDNWRVDERLGGASRAFADIGSHWCDLAEFVSGHRITRAVRTPAHRGPERSGAAGRKAFESDGGGGATAAGHDRGRGPRPVRDGRRRARVGRGQPDLGGPQEPALDRARRRRGDARLRPGAPRGAVVRAAGSRWRSSAAIPRRCRRPPRAMPVASRRPSAGLRGLLRRLRGRLLRRGAQRLRRRTGCPRSPTGSAPPLITDAVLTSAREERWVESRTPSREPAVT